MTTERVIDVADAGTYDELVHCIHRCLECRALLLSEDAVEHIEWHRHHEASVAKLARVEALVDEYDRQPWCELAVGDVLDALSGGD